ncbi:MAG TPA: chlorite dismutase family protein [Chloroflexota bacterium]|nr:chlorite dismutase family protein [Chloroflexota bacterium]
MAQRQLVSYSFYKVDPAWRTRSIEQRCSDKASIVEAAGRFADDMLVRTYSTVGSRGDTDFLIWRATEDLALLHQSTAAINRTSLGPFLTMPHHYLAMTRRSMYVTKHVHSGQEGTRTRIRPSDAPYLIVYPFVKTRAWYMLSKEERQAMMDEHIAVGHKYPSVKINTTYSFGFDDQDFVVAFETDSISDFLDLVMELRESKASLYTVRDTPAFTCLAKSLDEALDAVG